MPFILADGCGSALGPGDRKHGLSDRNVGLQAGRPRNPVTAWLPGATNHVRNLMNPSLPILLFLAATIGPAAMDAAEKIIERSGETRWIKLTDDGSLTYVPDDRGDVVIDYSHCGYAGGGVAIPDVPVAITLTPSGADDGQQIQAAIDELASRPIGADGFRGAILLAPGTFRVGQELHINASGIVLRGSGSDPETGTTLLATMRWEKPEETYEELRARGLDRKVARRMTKNGQKLITLGATNVEWTQDEAAAKKIVDSRVPVGARTMKVEDGHGFKPGDRVLVNRHTNMDWVAAVRMHELKPGGKRSSWWAWDYYMDRIITAVDGNRVTIDAPIVIAIDDRWGGARLPPRNRSVAHRSKPYSPMLSGSVPSTPKKSGNVLPTIARGFV